jgi:hypothetical protein
LIEVDTKGNRCFTCKGKDVWHSRLAASIHIMAMRLNNEGRKIVEIRKELRPRSFKVKVSGFITSFIIFLIKVGYLNNMDFISTRFHTWK